MQKNRKSPLSQLKSIQLNEVADALTDMQIDIIRNDSALGGAVVADRLTQLREAVWSAPVASPTTLSDHKDVFKRVLEGLSDEQKTLLFESYARMGHLNEIAALVVRENHFMKIKQAAKSTGVDAFVPGGVDQFVASQSSVEEAVQKLNQPTFEVVMTQHPTNVNSLESMQAQRALSLSLYELLHTDDQLKFRKKELHDAEQLASGEKPKPYKPEPHYEEGALQGSLEKIKRAMSALMRAPVLNQNEKHEDRNFSVSDETRIVINSLSNVYDDLPRVYHEYDEALSSKNARGGEYKPEHLNLHLNLKSWGSAGDKDGNKNVTSEKTLEAIALHTDKILSKYLGDMQDSYGEQNVKTWRKWRNLFTEARAELNGKEGKTTGHTSLLQRIIQLREDADAVRNDKKILPPEDADLSKRFDALSAELAALRSKLSPKQFEGELTNIYLKSNDNYEKHQALDMARKVRVFGFELAKIEYRETAEEYTRVVSTMVKGYDRMSVDKREKVLTDLILNNEPHKLFEAAKEHIIAGGANLAYSDDNALPIAYHTLKRMQLTRDHDSMFEDNVLAECGKLPKKGAKPEDAKKYGAVNMLEAKFLQLAAADDKGHAPLLGIVPLFEEPQTMENIDKIMRGAYENPAYQQHMADLADKRYGGKLTQQVQIAHSDNARRAGVPAARAYIHEAHKKLDALNTEKGIQGQFFIGGSISDAYRNGVRAISASVDSFGMHKFAKLTFQGGDLLNYFNTPFSSARLFTRQFTHAASSFVKEEGNWVSRPASEKKENEVFDQIVIDALKSTVKEYRKHDFVATAMGILLAAIGYKNEIGWGSLGSRTDTRNGQVIADNDEKLEAVPIKGVRTIGFSEAWQHNALVPSWIGSRNIDYELFNNIQKKLKDYTSVKIAKMNVEVKELEAHGKIHTPQWNALKKEHDDAEAFVEGFSDLAAPLEPELKKSNGLSLMRHFSREDSARQEQERKDKIGKKITAKHYELLYESSPTFKDAMDKTAHAVALSDIAQTKQLVEPRLAERADDSAAQAELRKNGRDYMQRLEETYQKAGKMAYAALKGQLFTEAPLNPHDTHHHARRHDGYNPQFLRHNTLSGKIADGVTQEIPSIGKEILRKKQYRDFLIELKLQGGLKMHDGKVLHAAGDTVMHGRLLPADDPEYGKYLKSLRERNAATGRKSNDFAGVGG